MGNPLPAARYQLPAAVELRMEIVIASRKALMVNARHLLQ